VSENGAKSVLKIAPGKRLATSLSCNLESAPSLGRSLAGGVTVTTASQLPLLTQPPSFCEYAAGPCDQSFENAPQSEALFLYPNDPEIIAATVEEAASRLRLAAGEKRWFTWKDLGITGQVIFCQICKAMRYTRFVVADLTTLNFNLLFEVGYAIGLRVPVLPIRDTSFMKDTKVFNELGLIDTVGYFDFQNAAELVNKIITNGCPSQVLPQVQPLDKEKPLYVMKSPVQSEGMVRLMSAVKKSGLRFRSFDPRESSRLSLHDAFKQASSSLGIIMHLMSPERRDSTPHNGRCAFVAGLGLATGKHVLMLQETQVTQPIDYRDVVRCYSSPKEIQDLIIPFVKSVVGMLQESRFVPTSIPLSPLEKVDLGDFAAENEIIALQTYFVPTGQYNEVNRGHARLVVGRKGAGKTAIFYGVREAHTQSRAQLLLDLKPEGHQLVKLRETILHELSPGMQQHVLTAFWNYLLLMEIAHKIIRTDQQTAYRDSKLLQFYEKVRKAYSVHMTADVEQGDFSERLLALVDDIVERRQSIASVNQTGEVTQLIYRSDIRQLNDAIGQYLAASRKEDVWLLFDNLDKGWPVFNVKPEDITIITSLLEATRKLQRQFENRSLSLHAIVFLRNDIYQHLIVDPGDRGKESPVILDWNDPETLKEMLRKRIAQSTELNESFEELWRLFFASHVGGEESFSFVLGRTLMRPRELLRFVRDCINVAVNRRHEQVTEEDILHAERSYSDDALVDLSLELKDVRPDFADAPYGFIGAQANLPQSEVGIALIKAGIPADQITKVRGLLLWFGFLGIYVYPDEERYSYQYEHNLRKMSDGIDQYSYCIHPAFRKALGCATP
jgi:hypothetical protein